MHFLFFFLPLLVLGAEIELFCDWSCDAKGIVSTLENVPEKELSLNHLLSRHLKERGHLLKSLDIDAYHPWLITWKGVKNFQDLKHWLKLGLGRKQPILPETKYWMFWNLGPKLKECNLAKTATEKMILVMWEPPTVQKELYDPKIQSCFGKIFTWDDDLVDNKKFFKFHYPALVPMANDLPSFEEKKFCVMICRRLTSKHPRELYSMRKKMIRFFEEKPAGEFDLYGYFWEREKFKNWRGALHSNKIEKLKEYKFSICYENMGDVKGYITEKIFDCFGAGVIPVYWGASNVTDYIPADCFIDRRKFASDEEVYQFMKQMSAQEYEGYLARIRAFLQSDQAKLFTAEHFIQRLLQLLT